MEVRVGICCRGLDAGSFPAAIHQEGSTDHAMEARVGMHRRGLDIGSSSAERMTPTGEQTKHPEKKCCARSGSLSEVIDGN